MKDDDISGRIFRVESLNTHNGPGFRTVIYLKGCPLSCLWCHNPEGISTKKEIWVNHSKCIACLSCITACPNSALSYKDNKIDVDRHKCKGCYQCAEICPSKAIEKLGEDFTVNQVFNRIIKDKSFIDASGGGVTVTGGEPGIAPEFVGRLFQKCRKVGIHTAFDTSGVVSKKALEMIIPFTDLVFFDLKIMDKDLAKRMTGQGTTHALESLDWIKNHKKLHGGPELQIRTPIIPGATDSSENLGAIKQLISDNYKGLFSEWELNLFNDICEDKYQKLDEPWQFKEAKFDGEDYNLLENFRNENPKMKIKISGFVQK